MALSLVWCGCKDFIFPGDYDYHCDHLDTDQDHDAVNEDETKSQGNLRLKQIVFFFQKFKTYFLSTILRI